jgi:hypothetical protein
MSYIAAMSRVCHHERFVARSYQALSNLDSNIAHKYLFMELANLADRRALHYELRLRSSGLKLLPDNDTWMEIFWRWIFLKFGIRYVMNWLEWIQRKDVGQLGTLLMMQKRWR